MWSYYGSKSKIVHLYPRPRFDKIIEPFAGTARYSLMYWDHDITIVDKYEVIVKIWRWLQKCSQKDILSLPSLKQGDRISREMFDCDEQFWLMGFLIGQGLGLPRVKATKLGTKESYGRDGIKEKRTSISRNLHKCRNWNIVHGDYTCLGNIEATWYIDPPYQHGGQHQYVHGNRELDFQRLGSWCRERNGQSIVCENTKADWLPFRPMKVNQGIANTFTTEAIWSNLPTDYDFTQLSIFQDGEYL
jgi:site-specific DNA-adenine methylase